MVVISDKLEPSRVLSPTLHHDLLYCDRHYHMQNTGVLRDAIPYGIQPPLPACPGELTAQDPLVFATSDPKLPQVVSALQNHWGRTGDTTCTTACAVASLLWHCKSLYPSWE
ncbi:hypothetical protein E4U43_000911 [Claviceps pusilla]|uniref:Uncharacterized protein n=1 Tax=Claviceps pusilla TaxID=123648 RepID=A0A9P7SWD1_9HYPO|nr:hypothetical protein E4U43_000911 [Claviceps pusilla]